MKKRKIKVCLRHKGKNFFLKTKKCGWLDEIFGLMFQKREDADVLLFDFSGRKKPALHSFFVFFPFLAVWLDDKNKIVEIRVVNPFSFNVSSKKAFGKIVEVPINSKYSKIIQKLVGKRKI